MFPRIGFGTYRLKKSDVLLPALQVATETGYTMLDTAELYKNQHIIGEFLKTRDSNCSLWITSKVEHYTMLKGEDAIRTAIQQTLADLGRPVDLYLIHCPNKNDVMTWSILREFQDTGNIRHLGVSNYRLHELQAFQTAICGNGRIFCNQIECGLFLWERRKELVEFCQKQGICVAAYGILNGHGTPEIQDLAATLQITAAQLLIAWALHRGLHVLVSATDTEKIRENIAAAIKIQLSKSMLETLEFTGSKQEICSYPRFK